MEAIEQLEHELEEVKQQRKETPHHLEWDELPVEDKFELIRSDISATIDAAVAPFVFTALQKRKLVGAVLRRKFAREGN